MATANPPITDRLTDRALYTLLVGVASGAASLLATRLVQAIWRRRRGEVPKAFGPLKTLGGKAGERVARTAW